MSDMGQKKNNFQATLYNQGLLWYNKNVTMIRSKFSYKQEDIICPDPVEERAEAAALVEAASEAVASEAAEDLAAVVTAEVDLAEAREARTVREVLVSDGASVPDLDGALALVITVEADALAALWGL